MDAVLDRDAGSRETIDDSDASTISRTPRKSIRGLVAPNLVKNLSKPNEWVAIGTVLLNWFLMAAAVAVSVWADSWFVTIPLLFFIATRMHSLLVMMHDAAHFLISHNRTLNDTVCNLFCSMPFLVSARRYRDNHSAHHRNLNAEDDPDIADNTPPRTLFGLALVSLQDLCFLSVPKAMRRSRKFGVSTIFFTRSPGFALERVVFLGMVATVVTGLTYFHAWPQFLLYWVVPMFSPLQLLLRLRGYAEHAGRMHGDYLTQARSIDVGFIERVAFAPCRVNRHLEHHLYPSVPFHRLEELTQALRRNPEFNKRAHRTRGYVASRESVLREIYGRQAPTAH